EYPDPLASVLYDLPQLTRNPKQGAKLLLELAVDLDLWARLDLMDNELGQASEHLELPRRDIVTCPRIHDTEDANSEAVGRAQGHAGIEPDSRLGGDQRTLAKARILSGVGHHQDIETTDGPSTERLVARHFPERQARVRLEPLPPLVDERDECNRRLE